VLKVVYRLKLGQDEFELQAEVKDEKDFFEQMSFYSNLPRTAPNGATDLKLVFRTTKKGHKYYSLISELEQMEFRLGQNLEANGGGLFPKGWQKAYQSDADEDQQGQAAPAFGQQQAAPKQQAAPAQNAAPAFGSQAPAAAAPAPQAAPAAPFQMPQPQTFGQTAPQAAAPAPAAPAPQAAPNPQVAAVANNVLSRFGIKQ